jgi:hypothetical protein
VHDIPAKYSKIKVRKKEFVSIGKLIGNCCKNNHFTPASADPKRQALSGNHY